MMLLVGEIPPLELLAPGASVTAVIVVVVIFLRHMSARDVDLAKTLEQQWLQHTASLKLMNDSHAETVKSILDARAQADQQIVRAMDAITSEFRELKRSVDHLAGRFNSNLDKEPHG